MALMAAALVMGSAAARARAAPHASNAARQKTSARRENGQEVCEIANTIKRSRQYGPGSTVLQPVLWKRCPAAPPLRNRAIGALMPYLASTYRGVVFFTRTGNSATGSGCAKLLS